MQSVEAMRLLKFFDVPNLSRSQNKNAKQTSEKPTKIAIDFDQLKINFGDAIC